MCGRFVQKKNGAQLKEQYQTQNDADVHPSYNIAPGAGVPVVLNSRKTFQRELHFIRWGLIPSWIHPSAKYPRPIINTRAETIHQKVSFRESFKERRCVIPADGFYEWHCRTRQPYYIYPKEENFSFAGIWDRWKTSKNEVVVTCSIITTAAHPSIAEIHERMPAILSQENIENWLSEEISTEQLTSLLVPYPDVAHHPISKEINSPSSNHPSLTEPLLETAS